MTNLSESHLYKKLREIMTTDIRLDTRIGERTDVASNAAHKFRLNSKDVKIVLQEMENEKMVTRENRLKIKLP